MSQSPFKLKTVRSIFSFGASQPSQGSQEHARSSPQPVRCIDNAAAGKTATATGGSGGGGGGGGSQTSSFLEAAKKKRSLNLALSQVTLGSPVEGLAACASAHHHPVLEPTATQNMSFTQSQDFFCTPDFITPNDAHVKLPAPGFNASSGMGISLNSNPPTRDFTPLGVKRPRSVFDVLMCPENRRSQLQAYTQELNAYKPPGTRVRGGVKNTVKAVMKSPSCVKNPFKDALRNVPKHVQQENLLNDTEDEMAVDERQAGDAFDEPQPLKRKKSTNAKKRRRKKKMYMTLGGMNDGRYRTDFKEVSRVGHGSFSTVYRCIHRLDGSEYAVKHVKNNLNKSNADIAQALQEVQAYSALGSHPHLLNYHTCWIENTKLYIQLELSECCLTDLTKQGKTFDEEELTLMLWSILQALHHMHSNSLAHMDVKPDNIHIVNNKYKIGDLGTCTKYSRGEGKEMCATEGPSDSCLYREGDARYMAPELLNDNLKHLDKSDIWALGATAYELARKCPLPMKGENYRHIREDKLAVIPSFSAQFFDLVSSMMNSDPLNRPTAEDIMKSSFFDGARNNM